MDILFAGTPDFAVNCLAEIYESKKINICGVITQPDRKRGRGQKMQSTPVKKKAEELNLKVYTEKNINKPSFIDKLKEISPEAIVVVAFGQKLSQEILSLPDYGCINLHASLLPQYRGACPIHKAIINGDKVTGVTTMYMDEGWDTGDIIYKEKVEIGIKDTVGLLHDKLAQIGSRLLVKTLLDVEKDDAPRKEQNENKASYACKFDKSIGEIDWNKSAEEIYNLVRGVNPWPCAYTKIDNKLLKIWEVEIESKERVKADPGSVIQPSMDKGLIVQTGKGLINIKKLQLAGRKKMSVEKFLCGYNIDKGEKLE